MEEKNKIQFKINPDIIKDYIKAISPIDESVEYLKKQFDGVTKKISQSSYDKASIDTMQKTIKQLLKDFPTNRSKVQIDAILQILRENNNIISTKMIAPLNISRQYLLILQNNKILEKVARGIYISSQTFEDDYFIFQQKYQKTIFSHMHALFFHGMTEELPYTYTVTVPQNYHIKDFNQKCNVFYVSDAVFGLGVANVKTTYGNTIRVYNVERSICDIIRSEDRMDPEQVRKVIRAYINSHNKDMLKLSDYSKQLKVYKKTMDIIGRAYYD